MVRTCDGAEHVMGGVYRKRLWGQVGLGFSPMKVSNTTAYQHLNRTANEESSSVLVKPPNCHGAGHEDN